MNYTHHQIKFHKKRKLKKPFKFKTTNLARMSLMEGIREKFQRAHPMIHPNHSLAWGPSDGHLNPGFAPIKWIGLSDWGSKFFKNINPLNLWATDQEVRVIRFVPNLIYRPYPYRSFHPPGPVISKAPSNSHSRYCERHSHRRKSHIYIYTHTRAGLS